MEANQNEGFERAYQSEDFADYYGSKHESSATLRFRNRREIAMWTKLLSRLPKSSSILDCPAGAGRFWPFLRNMTSTLVAVDSSAEMMGRGQKVQQGFAPDSCEVAMAQDLPFPDNSFDLVFCSRLLHHFPQAKDRQEILSSFSRVSRGYVAFSTWRTGNYKSLRNSFRRENQTRFFASMGDIENDVKAAGLTPIHIQHKQRLVSPIVAVLCRVNDSMASKSRSEPARVS